MDISAHFDEECLEEIRDKLYNEKLNIKEEIGSLTRRIEEINTLLRLIHLAGLKNE